MANSKIAINETWKGRSLSFSFRRGVVTLNDRVTQQELDYLLKIGHPAVYIVKEDPKPKKEVTDDDKS